MNLKHSILKTIAFFDIFNFPLTAEEVKEYLYNFKKPVHIKEVKGSLDEMDNIERIHDYYVLKDRAKLADLRKSRKFIAEKYWGRVRQYGQYIVQVPFVKMVAVCNNLAYDNATELSDIDLFIVIKKGRMWFARLFITLILQFFGVRRYGNKIAGRFCLSFFITPEKLNAEPLLLHPEDPYMAYWTKLLMPIYGKKTYQQFMDENRGWLDQKYGLKFSDLTKKHLSFRRNSKAKRFWEWIFGGHFGDLCEWMLKKTFKKRTLAKSHKLGPEANVVVSDEMLKFHNYDKRTQYLKEWKERL